MNLKTKKKIAKEILILFSSLILALVFFLMTYSYNWIIQKKISNLTKAISAKEETSDSLSKLSFNDKIINKQWFFIEISKKFDILGNKTANEQWSRLLKVIDNDSLEYFFENKWSNNLNLISLLNKLGFNNASQLKEFVLLNTLSQKEKIDYTQSIIINEEIKKISSEIKYKEDNILSYKEQKENGIKALIIIFSIVYPFRFLYLIIIWALKTIRQKESV